MADSPPFFGAGILFFRHTGRIDQVMRRDQQSLHCAAHLFQSNVGSTAANALQHFARAAAYRAPCALHEASAVACAAHVLANAGRVG